VTGPLIELHPTVRREFAGWRQQKVESFPAAVQAAVLEQVNQTDVTDYRAANVWLGEVSRDLTAAQVGRAFDEQLIRDHAANYARLCSRMRSLEARQSFAVYIGIAPPAGKTITTEGAAKRLDDPIWWRRQLRKRWTRAAENGMRDIGMVRKGRQPYASDAAVQHRAAQKRRAREFMERSQLVNDQGEQLEMLQVAERSIANPAIRRGEFMARVRGFEEIARDLGHVAEFVTLTAPSFFHAYLAGAGRNPLFQRAIVREAQQWLCRQWARARAKLKRLSVLVYGFRIAEPHHDGTPHFHLLLFVRTRDVDTLRTVLRSVWLSEYGDEKGAREYRAKFETVDPAKGSATGYISKYVSKNIDGAGAIANESDTETDSPVSTGVARVDAWASIHGIRQFQQVGGPPVGLWREARRIRVPIADRDLERVRQCADGGDWRRFVQSVGGIHAGRRTNVKLETVETGEINKYGECRPARVIGLRCASAVAISRPHRWQIQRKCSVSRSLSSLGPVEITVRIGATSDETVRATASVGASIFEAPADQTGPQLRAAGPHQQSDAPPRSNRAGPGAHRHGGRPTRPRF
jgi:hypothetical protein